MHFKPAISLFILCFVAMQLLAQSKLPMARNIQAAYHHNTRSSSGQPGKNYWQNTANYNLDIHFNPATRLVSGTADIEYVNNSPDTLMQIVFKLYTDLYKRGAMRVFPIEAEDAGAGMMIETISINGATQDMRTIAVQGTNMMVPVAPLLPGERVSFSIKYVYTLNKGSHIRTGEIAPGAYFIAYSFPRIAVYDDVDGWNMAQYLGTYEFYHDFCNFNVAITVPRSYAVWATGTLANSSDVYSPAVHSRLLHAEQADGYITIIDSAGLVENTVTADRPVNTFHFKAAGVTDFAFATSNRYVWQATSLVVDSATGRRTRVDAVYNPQHTDFEDVVKEARHAVEYMSFRFPKWPFPYSHETVFEGLDKMEYPMMVNDVPQQGALASFSLTAHEIFHTMFPFYMGTNETKYGWMDEGWSTIGEWLLTPMYLPGVIDSFMMAGYENAAGLEIDLPIMTPSTQLQGIYYENESAFSLNSYPKPGLGYLYVKDLLGNELFLKGLHHYIRSWRGKHPLPYDFFNCMNVGSGKNLDWFWQAWFFDSGFPNLAVSNVDQVKKQVTVSAKGSKPVPVDLTIYYSDGTVDKIHRSVAVWEKGNRTVVVPYQGTKPLIKVELGAFYNADIDKTDNVWLAK